jgi:hypothetical protein
MSTVVCMPSPLSHLNDQHTQHLYAFDHHQQRQTTTTSSPNLLSNRLNEDEHCQICGDLASGWHCGLDYFFLIYYPSR